MPEDTFSGTKVTLVLGGESYVLNYGLQTMRRIEEAHPKFSLLNGETPAFEILPILIKGAIAEPKWKTEQEFEELFDSCTDEDGLSKVLLAYQNAVGFTDRVFVPVVSRIRETIEKMQQDDEAKKAKPKK